MDQQGQWGCLGSRAAAHFQIALAEGTAAEQLLAHAYSKVRSHLVALLLGWDLFVRDTWPNAVCILHSVCIASMTMQIEQPQWCLMQLGTVC